MDDVSWQWDRETRPSDSIRAADFEELAFHSNLENILNDRWQDLLIEHAFAPHQIKASIESCLDNPDDLKKWHDILIFIDMHCRMQRFIGKLLAYAMTYMHERYPEMSCLALIAEIGTEFGEIHESDMDVYARLYNQRLKMYDQDSSMVMRSVPMLTALFAMHQNSSMFPSILSSTNDSLTLIWIEKIFRIVCSRMWKDITNAMEACQQPTSRRIHDIKSRLDAKRRERDSEGYRQRRHARSASGTSLREKIKHSKETILQTIVEETEEKMTVEPRHHHSIVINKNDKKEFSKSLPSIHDEIDYYYSLGRRERSKSI